MPPILYPCGVALPTVQDGSLSQFGQVLDLIKVTFLMEPTFYPALELYDRVVISTSSPSRFKGINTTIIFGVPPSFLHHPSYGRGILKSSMISLPKE
mgnify:FL=1